MSGHRPAGVTFEVPLVVEHPAGDLELVEPVVRGAGREPFGGDGGRGGRPPVAVDADLLLDAGRGQLPRPRREGTRVAVAGLGGLGHLGVKFAVALDAEVTVLSRTPDKAADARKLGAVDLLLTTDEGQMDQARGRYDLILDTISAPHDVPPLLRLLGLDGTLCLLGYPGEIPLRIMDLIYGRKKLTASGTGGRRGTAEMLAFSAEHGITADIELLPSARVEEALTRLDKGDVRYRFVLDLADLDRSAPRLIRHEQRSGHRRGPGRAWDEAERVSGRVGEHVIAG